MTGNDTDAQDATQEALIAVVRGLPRFDGRAAFTTWMYRVATNACLDELRRRKRRPEPASTETESLPRSSDATPELDQTLADRFALDAALATLSDEFRSVIVLRDVLGLDYAAIAEVLALPAGTVRSRIARGRAELARRLGNPAGDINVGTEAP